MRVSTGGHGDARASDPLELELQAVVTHLLWVLEITLAALPGQHELFVPRAISPAYGIYILCVCVLTYSCMFL